MAEYLTDVSALLFCSTNTNELYLQKHLKLLLGKEWLVRIDGNHSIPYLMVGLSGAHATDEEIEFLCGAEVLCVR